MPLKVEDWSGMLISMQDYKVGLVGLGDCEGADGDRDTRILMQKSVRIYEAFGCTVIGSFRRGLV